MTTSSGQATPTKYCARHGSFSTIGTKLGVLPCCCIGRDARRLYQPTLFCEGVVPVPPRPLVLLALSFCLSPGSAAASPWTAARDALARLFSAAETCELAGEVAAGRGVGRPGGCPLRRLHQRDEHRPPPDHDRRAAGAPARPGAAGRGSRPRPARHAPPSRDPPGVPRQLLRHHLARAHEQLKLLRR